MLSQGLASHIVYFKRFRMELDLDEAPPVPSLPEGFEWVAWRPELLNKHAEVKYHSFRDEIDALVFPNLGTLKGCQQLMRDITVRVNFHPEATWMIRCGTDYCGTVQGLTDRTKAGGIQNLGVAPMYRGLGLGSALLLKALQGFQRVGLRNSCLEVTAQNVGALQMYRRLGFRCRKTIYKAVDTEVHPMSQKAKDLIVSMETQGSGV
ncbi:MAG: GNAT family N-acetyltransferase [Gemmataceae bacterium]